MCGRASPRGICVLSLGCLVLHRGLLAVWPYGKQGLFERDEQRETRKTNGIAHLFLGLGENLTREMSYFLLLNHEPFK